MTSVADFLNGLATGNNNQLNSLDTNRQLCEFLDLSITCLADAEKDPVPGYCPRIWRFDKCWPSTPYNTTSMLNCSTNASENGTNHFVGFHCNSTTGTWNGNTEESECYDILKQSLNPQPVNPPAYDLYADISEDYASNYSDNDFSSFEQNEITEETMGQFRILECFVTTGYSISFASLIVAFLLFLLLKRLHCTRVFIHMNLMIAFMIRGIMWIFHMAAFQDSNSIETDLDISSTFLAMKVFGRYNASYIDHLQTWKKDFCDPFNTQPAYIWCRIYYVISNYAVTASYYWLLIEGIYLCLILRAMNPLNLHKLKMRWFLFFGWVLPIFSVMAYVLAKVLDENENKSCWYEDKNKYLWLIIKVPILISVLINFVIFVLVIHTVGSKLKHKGKRPSSDSENGDFKWRLTKSTLALIPLLGIQYIVSLFFTFIDSTDVTYLFLKSSFELLFTSIQGFLISLLYCFLNNDVQEEVKREWRRIKTNLELNVLNPKKRNNTPATSLMNLYSFSVSKKQRAQTKRGDSVCTNGKSSAESSPRRSRFSTLVTETTRISPFSVKKIFANSPPTADTSLLDNVEMKETCLLLTTPDDATVQRNSTSFTTNPRCNNAPPRVKDTENCSNQSNSSDEDDFLLNKV